MSSEAIRYAAALKFHSPFHILENDWCVILDYNTFENQLCFGVIDIKPGTAQECVFFILHVHEWSDIRQQYYFTTC